VLSDDVERVLRNAGRFDVSRQHAFGGGRAGEEVVAVLRMQHPLRHGVLSVAGTPDPLETRRHRRRRLDLHHEVDGPHVDP
jgi:hypothetical protein